MAGGKLDLWQAGSLAKSINVNQPDFQSDVQLTDATVNATSGIVEGIGPRYGFAPIPGQMDQETVVSGQLPGIMRAELGLPLTGASGTWERVGIFGIYPIRMGGPTTSLGTINTYYVALIAYTTTVEAGIFLDTLFLGTTPTTAIQAQEALISAGLFSTGAQFKAVYTAGLDSLYLIGSTQQSILNFAQLTAGTTFVSSTSFSISGSEIPMQWVAGKVNISQGGATTAPSLSLAYLDLNAQAVSGGVPPSFNYGNFPLSPRNASVFALDLHYNQNIDYTVSFTASTNIFKPLYFDNPLNFFTQIDLSAITATKTTSGTNYAGTEFALFNDNLLTCNSSYQGILAASGKAQMFVFQDWYNSGGGNIPQYVDLSNIPSSPPDFFYSEDGAVVPCCFAFWPAFVRGTPMNTSEGVTLGAANTGLLQANTVYEFTYSVYDKRLNFETNVGSPVKIQTGTNDQIAMQLFVAGVTSGTETAANFGFTSNVSVLPWPGTSTTLKNTSNINHVNFMQYRFYYRQEGMEVWLPAFQVDAAQYWFYPHWVPMFACTGAIGGTPGGETGGFQDYSTLPQGNWTCTLFYKNRAFWLSDKQLIFSLLNNPFAYPGRNSVACPSGTFKGAIVQAYYGQANQNARIVIFSTDGTYVGVFTGQQQVVSLTLDTGSATLPPTVAQFPLDGSDFVVNAWTSVTAFSYRSAVVAEGLLYFWGPQGIFLDDGVNPIQRISIPLEPQIFGLYDASQTDSIHCEYNDTTKEIWWFYPPANGATMSSGICFNKLKGTWLYGSFDGQVDSVQSIHVDDAELTSGTRLIAFSRENSTTTIQRAYYFDQNNLAGDIYPGDELMVKAISIPTAGQRRLTLAAGHSTGTIAAGDLIALQQCPEYATTLATPSDFVAEVSAVGSGTIDIILPTGATLDASATIASNASYFPIWHAAGTKGVITGPGINGFTWNIDTKFWIPGGMNYWAFWLWTHMVFKLYDLLPGPDPVLNFNYQTPISQGVIDSIITLIDNSAGNFQIMRGLARGNQNGEGQGIKYTWSGIQLAGSWVLQFLEAYSQAKDGNQLQLFQG